MGYYDNYLEHSGGAWKKHKYIRKERKAKGWRYYYKEKLGVGLKDEIENERQKQQEAAYYKETANNQLNEGIRALNEAKEMQKNGYIDKDAKGLNRLLQKSMVKKSGLDEQMDSDIKKAEQARAEATKTVQKFAGEERTAKAKADVAQAKYDKSLLGIIEKIGKKKLKDIFN